MYRPIYNYVLYIVLLHYYYYYYTQGSHYIELNKQYAFQFIVAKVIL